MKNSEFTKIVTWNPLLTAAFCAGVLLLVLTPARATILLFDVGLTGNDVTRDLTTSPWNAYGDNVNSLTQTIDSTTATYAQGIAFTPNIQLGYSFFSNPLPSPTATNLTAYHNTAGNGFGGAVAYLGTANNPSVNPASFYFTLTPDSGYKPIVNSFEVGTYGPTSISITWNLREGSTSGTIFNTGNVSITTTNLFRTGSQISITNNGSFSGITVLEIVQTGGGTGNLGFDNLNFDQVAIPEPGTVALVTIGLGFALLRSRKLFGKHIG